MSQALLEVRDLRVDYADVTAARDVSFDVEAGMVYGLIGPNGAGKTSIMRAVANLVEATYGVVKICGTDVLRDPRGALSRLGYMPDFPPLYEDLTVREFLMLFASAYGIPRGQRWPRIDAALADTDMTGAAGSLTGGLSRGMKQRLFLAKTLVHDPDVLVLDEPASGLDPDARAHLAAVLRRLGESGKAVLVSSHILTELEEFCNSVGIMDHGLMKVSGRVDEVVAGRTAGKPMRVALAYPDERLSAFLDERADVLSAVVDGASATFELEGNMEQGVQLLADLVQARFAVAEFTGVERRLQDLFFEVREEGKP